MNPQQICPCWENNVPSWCPSISESKIWHLTSHHERLLGLNLNTASPRWGVPDGDREESISGGGLRVTFKFSPFLRGRQLVIGILVVWNVRFLEQWHTQTQQGVGLAVSLALYRLVRWVIPERVKWIRLATWKEAFVCIPLYFSPSDVDLDCSLFAFSGKE